MDADRVLAQLRQYVLHPGEAVENRRDWPGILVFYAGGTRYEARPARWLVARAPWVDEAVRVVTDGFVEYSVVTHGLLLDRDGAALYLNDVAVMRRLGLRLGGDLDPVAYAELLSELYSGEQIDGPIVHPYSANALHPPGALIQDVDAFRAEYPFVAASPVSAPVVSRRGDEVTVDFQSYRHIVTGTGGAVDILQWTVTGGAGREASWSRRYVVRRAQQPPRGDDGPG